MLKKLFRGISLAFMYFFYGMKAADKAAFSSDESSNKAKGNIEVQDEEQSVYKDLLRGEVTQEVRELRHEMYYSERESHKYKYVGNGVVVKKNNLFDEDVKGIERSDGFKVQLIQNNSEDTGGIGDALLMGDHREYTIKIKRNFIPRFRIEEFTNKLVVKRVDEQHVMLDFYVTKYESQFNRRHKPFLNDMEAIYQGDKQSDIIDFNEVSFVTFKAYGSPDLVKYSYNNVEFDNIVDYNGDYVVKFFADIVEDGNDIMDEFYDEIAAKKNENHERRKNKNTINFSEIVANKEPEYNIDEAQKLIDYFKDNGGQ